METKRAFPFFLLILVHVVDTSSYTFYSVGIFAICSNTTSNKTERNKDAELFKQVVGDMQSDMQLNVQHNIKNYDHNIRYETFDVCDDMERLTFVVTEILLNTTLAIRNPSKSYQESKVVSIITHLPVKMSLLIVDVLSFTNVPIRFLESTDLQNGLFFPREFEFYTNVLSEIVKKFQWQDLFLILLKDEEVTNPIFSTYDTYYNLSIERFREQYRCLKLHTISIHEIRANKNYFSKMWLRGHERPAIILFGSHSLCLETIRHLKDLYDEIKVPILGHEIMGHHPFDYQFFPDTYFTLQDERRREKWIVKDSKLLKFGVSKKTINKIYKLKTNMLYPFTDIMYDVLTDVYILHILIKQAPISERLRLYNEDRLWAKYRHSSREFHSLFMKINSFFWYRFTANNLTLFSDTRVTSIPTKCNLVCGAGRFKTYGEIAGGYGWRCGLCPVNHYKSFVGDDGCIPCRGKLSMDDGNRTSCVETYTDSYPNLMEAKLFHILLGFSIIGILAISTTSVIFWVKRRTPVVISSDVKVTFVHLLAQFSTIVIIMILPFVKPSQIVCTARIVPISVGYVLNVSLMFIKSQKIVQAFLSKIPITEKDTKETVTLQIITIITSIILANSLLVITLKIQQPFSFALEISTMQRIYHCSTSFHGNVIIGFVMFVQLACFVQAFRGRNLPSVMNDGMSLVYVYSAIQKIKLQFTSECF